MKRENISRWINTVLVSILLVIMTASVSRMKDLNDNTEVLQVEVAILTTKFDNHIEFSTEGMNQVNENAMYIRDIRETYVTREEIHEMLEELRRYIRESR